MRFAFVGYKDYCDGDHVVKADFVTQLTGSAFEKEVST